MIWSCVENGYAGIRDMLFICDNLHHLVGFCLGYVRFSNMVLFYFVEIKNQDK